MSYKYMRDTEILEDVEIKIVRIDILFFPLDQTSFLRKQNSNCTDYNNSPNLQNP